MMINAVDEARATVVHNVLMIMTKMMIIAIRSMFLTIPMSNCNINVFYHKLFFQLSIPSLSVHNINPGLSVEVISSTLCTTLLN